MCVFVAGCSDGDPDASEPPPSAPAAAASTAGVAAPAPSRTNAWTVETIDDSPNDVGKYAGIIIDTVPSFGIIIDTVPSLHIAYFDDTAGSLRYTQIRSEESQVREEVVVGDSNAGDVSIAVSPTDQSRHISSYLRRGANLGHAWQQGEGDGWTLSVASETGTVGQYSSIAIGPDGAPHIAFYDATENALKHAWGTSNRVSGAWDWQDETIDADRNAGQHTSMAFGADGTLHISYYSPADGGVLRHARGIRDATGEGWTWSVTSVSDPASGSAGQYSSLALDSAGNPHIAHFLGGLNALAHSWGTWDDGKQLWVWDTETVDNDGSVGTYASLAIDSDDRLHISYFDRSNGALRYAAGTYTPGASIRGAGNWAWDTRLLDDPDGEIVGQHTSIAVDGSGAVYIAYYDETNGNLKLARTTEVQSTFGQAAPPSCALSLSLLNPSARDCEGIEEDSRLRIYASWVEYFRGLNPQHTDIFVSDSECGADADGSITGPFCNLEDAIATAREIPEATIRVGPGSYQLTSAELDNVSIEGLSTTNTTLQALPLDRPIFVVGATRDSRGQGPSLIKGVTLVGAVEVVEGGMLTLDTVRVRLEEGQGLVVSGATAELRMTNSELITSSPVTLTVPADPQSGAGTSSQEVPLATSAMVWAQNGAHLLMDDVCLEDLRGVAVLIDGATTTATISSTVIKNTQTDAAGQFGYGVAIQGGASVSIVDSTIVANHGVGILVDGPESSIFIRATHIGQTRANVTPGTGVGVMVQRGATATTSDSAVVSNAGPGLYVSNGATADVTGSVFEGNAFSGIGVVDANATLAGNSIVSSGNSPEYSGGVGVFTWRLEEDQPFDMTLRGNVIDEQPGSAAYVRGSQLEMTMLIEGNLFRNNGTYPLPGGVFLRGSLDGVSMSANCFLGSTEYLLLDNAYANLELNYYESATGEDELIYTIKQQYCDGSSPPVTTIDIDEEILPSPDNFVIFCGEPASPVQPLLEYYFTLQEGGLE